MQKQKKEEWAKDHGEDTLNEMILEKYGDPLRFYQHRNQKLEGLLSLYETTQGTHEAALAEALAHKAHAEVTCETYKAKWFKLLYGMKGRPEEQHTVEGVQIFLEEVKNKSGWEIKQNHQGMGGAKEF